MSRLRSTFQFYASLLDAYQDYLDAEQRWEDFYGDKEDPEYSCDEYLAKAEQELIDKLNRVPFESDAADKGTAFNNLVDCVSGTDTPKGGFSYFLDESGLYTATYNGKVFQFDRKLVDAMAEDFSNAIPQYHCVGQLETKYGYVTLYGYIDELLGFDVHDIKTTGRYAAFKFRTHWQHLVYPYCLRFEGADVSRFQYDIVLWGRTPDSWKFYTEVYNYDVWRDFPRLQQQCEGIIDFINMHRSKITDKKLFNGLDGQDEMVKKYGE